MALSKKQTLQLSRRLYFGTVQAHVEALGGHGGKINWSTVEHAFNTGIEAKDAATAVIKEQKGGK